MLLFHFLTLFVWPMNPIRTHSYQLEGTSLFHWILNSNKKEYIHTPSSPPVLDKNISKNNTRPPVRKCRYFHLNKNWCHLRITKSWIMSWSALAINRLSYTSIMTVKLMRQRNRPIDSNLTYCLVFWNDFHLFP